MTSTPCGSPTSRAGTRSTSGSRCSSAPTSISAYASRSSSSRWSSRPARRCAPRSPTSSVATGLEAELREAGFDLAHWWEDPDGRLRALAVVLGGERVTRVVILGGGSAGEAFVGALSRLEGDFEMTLVERALVGGECTYWACMPSKTLLRAPEILAAARQAPGAAEAIVRSTRRRTRLLVARPGRRGLRG